jgi:hypothetical protein
MVFSREETDFMSAWAKQFHKLGKRAPKKHDKILAFKKYAVALPIAPAAYDAGGKVDSWPVMLNTTIGDCTCASAGHLTQWWTACAGGTAKIISDDDILSAYKAVSGYDPATGQNDNGAAISDVLNYWRTNGIGGDKIAASAAIDPKNVDQIKQAIWMFGGIDIGVLLPIAAQGEANWDAPSSALSGDWTPGGWGGHCLSGDTEIPLLNGSRPRLKDISGTQQWLYSMRSDGAVKPGFASRIWKTGEKETIRLYFDKDGPLDCTPEHLIMMRNGSYRRADELEIGDSIMPFNTRLDKDGYERVYDPLSTKYLWTHRIVGEAIHQARKGVPVHHKDENKRNNHPDNLAPMSWDNHQSLHVTSEERREKSRLAMQRNWQDPEYRRRVSEAQKINGAKVAARLAVKGKQGFQNHKITGIDRTMRMMDVYDMTVDGFHNFATGSGIFVHNSVPIIAYDADSLSVITWGQRIKMSWTFFAAYCDEAFAVFSQDWITSGGNSLSGFDAATLAADIAQL